MATHLLLHHPISVSSLTFATPPTSCKVTDLLQLHPTLAKLLTSCNSTHRLKLYLTPATPPIPPDALTNFSNSTHLQNFINFKKRPPLFASSTTFCNTTQFFNAIHSLLRISAFYCNDTHLLLHQPQLLQRRHLVFHSTPFFSYDRYLLQRHPPPATPFTSCISTHLLQRHPSPATPPTFYNAIHLLQLHPPSLTTLNSTSFLHFDLSSTTLFTFCKATSCNHHKLHPPSATPANSNHLWWNWVSKRWSLCGCFSIRCECFHLCLDKIKQSFIRTFYTELQ